MKWCKFILPENKLVLEVRFQGEAHARSWCFEKVVREQQ